MDHVLDHVEDTPSPETAQGVVNVSSDKVSVTSEEVAVPTNEVAAVDEVSAAVSSDAAAGDDGAVSLDDVAVSSSHEVAGDAVTVPSDDVAVSSLHEVAVSSDEVAVSPSHEVTVSSDEVAVSPSHEVTVSSDEVAVSSSREATVSSDEVAVSSSHGVATPTDEVVVLSPEAADEVMVSLEEEVVVAVSMESSFEVVVSSNDDSSAKEEEEAPIEVEAPPGSDDGFVHVELSSTQKDEAMKSLSSIIKSEEEQANTDGDWVALSSPALKVQALEESTPPLSDSSAETSVHDVAPKDHGESRIISYHDVKTKSTNPAQDVDPKKRENYLSDAEFQTLFGMTKPEFYALPKWKQYQRKRNLDLF